MKTITEQGKLAFKQPTTQRKGVVLINGNYYDVYGVQYYADCYDEGKVIGNAIASQLDFDIAYMGKFDTFQYFDCIWTTNGYEYIDYGTFTVFDEYDQDEFNKHITAFDNLIKFNAPFEDKFNYPKTLYDELVNVCQQAGVTLGNASIPNGSFVVENNQFVDGESLKTVLKQICAISGNYAIVKNNVLYLQLKNVTSETIDKSQHEPVDWKRRSYGINQVILGDSQVEGEYVIREDTEDIALNGVHKLEILDNLFAYTQDKRNALVDALFNQVRGFGYIPFETKGEWLSYLEIGDTINLDGTDTILLRVNAKSPDALNTTMSAPAIIDSSIEYVDNTADVDNRLKLTERSVDKQNQVITDVVSVVDDQNTKISQITQTVDEINSKIQDIADITISGESNYATFTLDNINESEPIQIKVKPINENISYLYPNTGLYPSDNLYLKVRTIRFHNNTTNTNVDYELPDDLLIYDSETYDEFYLDYDSQTCQVTKRCQYNADGSVSPLATEQVINYPYPTITLADGDYTLSLLGYPYGYLFIRLMAKNIYTSQFYTKAETNSRINQKADEINLGVTQTLSNYSTTEQMNASINIKANEINQTVSQKVGKNEIISSINQTPESITINASKLNLQGYVTLTNLSTSGETSINGANIQTGTLSASKITSGTLDASKVSVTNLNASNITSGTLSADKISGGTINASNIAVTNITASNINRGSLTGANIDINNGTGFLRMLSGSAYNPYVSALNVSNKSNGISFRNSNTSGNAGSQIGTLHIEGSNLVMDATGNILIGGSSMSSGAIGIWSGYIHAGNLNIGQNYINNSNGGQIAINQSISLNTANGGYAYVDGLYANNRILTVGGSPSTLSVKENVEKKDTSNIPEILRQIDLYDYKYKKEIENGKEDYGYIIDYLEKIPNIKKYFEFYDAEKNGIKYKQISHEQLEKFLLGSVIELQRQIDELKKERESDK